jgi:single-strand DNA-binding protein
MSNGVNITHLIGNLGNDPETKFTQGGMAVCTMSVATTSTRKKDGEKIEETQWHRVKAFGKLAEICQQYLRKGSKVFITGSIRYGSYDKDGVKHYTTDIIADEMRMLDPKPQGERTSQPASRQAPARTPPPADDFADDDIPF